MQNPLSQLSHDPPCVHTTPLFCALQPFGILLGMAVVLVSGMLCTWHMNGLLDRPTVLAALVALVRGGHLTPGQADCALHTMTAYYEG
jgi:hypothetical protein